MGAWTIAVGWLLVADARGAEGDPEGLRALQDEAARANPALEAKRARIRELDRRAEVAGSWMDPMVSVEYSNAPVTTWSIGDHPMAGIQLRVQQTLQPPRWSAASRAVGERAVEAAAHELEDADLQLRASVAGAYWSLARTRLLRAVTEAHVALVEELREAVTARYQVGAVGQHAVLRLEVLRDRLRDDLAGFDAQEREWGASLGRALGREGPVRPDTPPEVAVVPPPAEVDWTGLASTGRPAVAALDARIASEQAGADLARIDALPEPSVWLGYRIRVAEMDTDPGTDFVSAGLGAPLPIGSARRAHGERDARFEAIARLRAEREALLDAIASDGERALARWQRAAERAGTYTDALLPAARSALQTTRSDFAVDRADFASLVEAETALLDLERAVISASIETRLQEAETAALVGTDVGGRP